MPRYDYECNDCGKVFEYMVSWEIADIHRQCPEPLCKGQLNRTIGTTFNLPNMDKMGRSR
jgi:putative FmdB family regulatory protein